jgi:ABC-2 type transport system permease protein
MQRELSTYFYSPIAYVVLTIFMLVSGIFFVSDNFSPGGESSLRILLGWYMPLMLVFFLPMLTMRLFSEEFRSGTIETLMCAPVGETEVVLGKFLGALVFYGLMLAATLVYAVIIALFGQLDLGLLLCTYIGLVLLGAMYIAVGLFFSACTSNQIVAVMCGFVLLAVFTFLANYLAQKIPGALRVVVQHLSVLDHYRDFARGLVDTNHVIYFLTSTCLFLFMAVKVLESRRWR